MQCKKCGRIMRTALAPRPHFYCGACDPLPAEGTVSGTVILWLGVILLVVGAWTLLG